MHNDDDKERFRLRDAAERVRSEAAERRAHDRAGRFVRGRSDRTRRLVASVLRHQRPGRA